MRLITGKFNNYKDHHTGWFSLYLGNMLIEIWLGNNWITIDWSRE